MIYNRNHRTAWGRGLSTLRLCFLTEDNVTGGVGSQREGLSGVSSLTLALNSLMALWRWGLRTKFSGTFIRARPLANTDHPTGSNPFRFASNDNTNYDALITDWSVRCPPNAWFPRVMSNHDPCMRRSGRCFLWKNVNKTIIRFGFRDIRFIQGLGKCY